MQGKEHGDCVDKDLDDLRPPERHEGDAANVTGFGILIRLLYRIYHDDTADGMQLCTQKADRNGNGNGLGKLDTA